MSETTSLTDETIKHQRGGDTYQEIQDTNGRAVILTYNDLWALIVCRTSMDGDWQRAREATSMVTDAARKRQVVDRLWKLEQAMDGLPAIPDDVVKLHLHRAHIWFNQRTVSEERRD